MTVNNGLLDSLAAIDLSLKGDTDSLLKLLAAINDSDVERTEFVSGLIRNAAALLQLAAHALERQPDEVLGILRWGLLHEADDID